MPAVMSVNRAGVALPSRAGARVSRVSAPRHQSAYRVAAPQLRPEMAGSWQTSVQMRAGCDASQLQAVASTPAAGNATRLVTRMGNPNTNGPFAPIVRVARSILGTKRFNSIRGQGISLHSQAIRSFCSRIGTDNKMIQKLIKKAKKNGERLGFLA
mmetsp:Transcript_5356/g.14901  ORF Transcript_5356/g.14901 Transcript_5356/m.14901 type:complete len:156 (+) Transcript_5356:105-572(+)|eukprot:CAMPEP_0117673554 /NCGR_PEP_ID=MMETSP0804-20121206/14537_1 /TAXON_ID=1074897 /ORGANISM="Tetraselmis astigmatica, Strain CCMP880" /LENGTH=155 /DNA_ID=CAMNT_0005482305 /DNA_START=91 /DNA_END=558 /DNA_ORIENTATION=-